MGTQVYKWKLNLHKVDPQVAGEYLNSLEQRDGEVIPSVIVEESKIKTVILHPCFEWDNDKAAEHYRIQQAKSVIRNMVILYDREEKSEPVAVRAFVHTSSIDEKETKYLHMDTIMSDEILKHRLLESAIRELNDFRRKYKDLVEVSNLLTSIDEFLYVEAQEQA